jgi:hypothetical protein
LLLPGEGETKKERWLTAAAWAAGIGLQFMAPVLRDRVPLSDDLAITSFLSPWWLFLQVVLLALWLKGFQRLSQGWTQPSRTVFAIVSAAIFLLLEPDLVTQVIEYGTPLNASPVRTALLWSTPLAFYLLPAALVIFSWLRRDRRYTLLRALGIGLLSIGILNFPFILWLTHLWAVYYQPMGS